MSNEIYKVDNIAVAAYLDINGLPYVGSEIIEGRNAQPVVVFWFEDKKGIARDLERAFRNSKEKGFRDSQLFFRNEVFKTLQDKKKG